MTRKARIAYSSGLMVAAWATVLLGWPTTTAACGAGVLALLAVFIAPL